MIESVAGNIAVSRIGLWLIVLALFLSCNSKSQNPIPEQPNAIYYTPAWSPDGTEIVSQVTRYDDSGSASFYITVLDATTGEVVRERPVDFPPPFGFSWTPDGQWLLFGASPGIFKMSSDLQTVIQLTSGQFHISPSYSGARDVIFFAVNRVPDGGLFSIKLDGDSLKRWSTGNSYVLNIHCFPDGSDSIIGYNADQFPFRLIVFDPDSIEDQVYQGREFKQTYPCRVSPSHQYIAHNDQGDGTKGETIWLIDRSTNAGRKLASGTGEGIDFSPDGRRLVYPVITGEVGLWIVDIETGERALLTAVQEK